jgi:hypothetical protein
VAANRILGTLTLPAGATSSPVDPSGSRLTKPATYPVTPTLVDLHQFWTVPGAPGDVLSWIEAHPPAGAKLMMTGAATRGTTSEWAGFSFLAPRGGGAPSELLLITVTAARGGGTALRADGQVIWERLRPAWERIPAGARTVAVSERGLNGHRSGRWTVTEPGRVKRAASLLDRLPAAQPGAVACPVDWGPYVTLVFAAGWGERIATAVVDGSGCLGVKVWIRGHEAPGLRAKPELLGQLSSALGISL